jgi:hypothetical protein
VKARILSWGGKIAKEEPDASPSPAIAGNTLKP